MPRSFRGRVDGPSKHMVMWTHLAITAVSGSFLLKKDLFDPIVRGLYRLCPSTLRKLSYLPSYCIWLQVLEVQSLAQESVFWRAGQPVSS